MREFLTLKDLFIKYRWRYAVGIFWLICVDSVQIILPRFLGYITDSFQSGGLTERSLLINAFYVLLTGILIFVFRYLWRMYIIGTARRFEYSLRDKYYKHLLELSSNFYNTHKTGDLMAHATNDINAVTMALGQGVVMLTDSLFLSIVTVAVMFIYLNKTLTLMSLIPLPAMAVTASIFSRKIHHRYKLVQDSFSNMSDIVQENISGMRIIKSFVQEDNEIFKFIEANKDYMNKNMSMVRLWGFMAPFIQTLSGLGFIIILWYGGTLVINGLLSLGDFVSFNMYLGLLIWPMMAIGWVINIMQRGAASMQRLNEIFHIKPDIYDRKVIDMDMIDGDIEIRDLTFSYRPGLDPALKNIDLTIKKGETLGIIGKTGSGKTSLCNLLLHMYNVPDNTITIGGVDINRILLAVLRKNIGFVPQENVLFSMSIKDNIAFGVEDCSDEDIIEAARIAHIHEEILEFPDGYNAMVGERGVTLSGGQRQRVSIARAIIKKPGYLIFDDCLSAVDTQTEYDVLTSLKDIIKDCTTIIISQRISTVQNADRIMVLDNGMIAEYGTHEELMKLGGLYYSTYQKQQLEKQLNEMD
ncbi:MAG: ABC transporter ATP-binding protein [Thermoanaerobacteraceae bacterium]|nr:ABC transporter ATP-binding protein [Thermoanaerobacteraceae bacterium]